MNKQDNDQVGIFAWWYKFFRAKALVLGVLKYLKCYFSKQNNESPTTYGMYV